MEIRGLAWIGSLRCFPEIAFWMRAYGLDRRPATGAPVNLPPNPQIVNIRSVYRITDGIDNSYISTPHPALYSKHRLTPSDMSQGLNKCSCSVLHRQLETIVVVERPRDGFFTTDSTGTP